MANNKNQHFVPRCYLRPFTLNEAGTAINVYNIDRQRFIPHAPVKNQCSKDYFYGQNERLESGIQLIESHYGRSLSQILSSNKVFSDENKKVLRLFWLFQYLRTEAAAKRTLEMMESTIKTSGVRCDDFQLDIKEVVQITMEMFAKNIHIIDDLKCCIVRNKTKQPFFTSDDPAVLTNNWLLTTQKNLGHSFGLGAAGLVTILPLSPKLLFLGYDGDVYNVQHKQGVVDIKSEREVVAYNQHQLLNCRANIFIHDKIHENMVHNAYLDVENIRPKARYAIHYAVKDGVEGDFTRYVVIDPKDSDKDQEVLLNAQRIHPRPVLWPSHIKIRKNGSVYTNGSGVGFVRYKFTFRDSRNPFRRERP